MIERIGVFRITGGRMRVSDPCYTKGTWCAGVLENVKDGEWEAFTHLEDQGSWGVRVKTLSVKHRATKIKPNFVSMVAPFEVGVDSGQAGFFDEVRYPGGDRGEDGEFNKDEFYDRCCHLIYDEKDAARRGGTIDEGAVSSSGYGDGGYTCTYTLDRMGQVVAAQIEFISDEDDEDHDDYDEGNEADEDD